MKLSFVIPTRNQAAFIRRTIDSCLLQGVTDAEVLVIDGQSTDGTQEILASYGERITWTSERDSGQAEAVNKGIARASGEIIAWINSDDFYPGENVLRDVLAVFAQDAAIEVVFGDALMVDIRGAAIRPYRNRAYLRASDWLVSPIGPSQPATFFRRDLYLRIGGLRQELHWALDYDLFLRMFAASTATRYVPRTLAHATFHVEAKTIRGMLPQIREVAQLKREHATHIKLGGIARVRMWLGVAELYLYWAVVKMGLRRVV